MLGSDGLIGHNICVFEFQNIFTSLSACSSATSSRNYHLLQPLLQSLASGPFTSWSAAPFSAPQTWTVPRRPQD